MDKTTLFPDGRPQRLFFAAFTVLAPAIIVLLSMLFRRLTEGLGLWQVYHPSGAVACAPLWALVAATCAAIATRPGAWIDAPWVRAVLILGVVLGAHHALLWAGWFQTARVWTALIGTGGFFGIYLPFVAGQLAFMLCATRLPSYLNRRLGWWATAAGLAALWMLAAFAMAWYFSLEDHEGWDEIVRLTKELAKSPGYLGFVLLTGLPMWTTDALGRFFVRLRGISSKAAESGFQPPASSRTRR